MPHNSRSEATFHTVQKMLLILKPLDHLFKEATILMSKLSNHVLGITKACFETSKIEPPSLSYAVQVKTQDTRVTVHLVSHLALSVREAYIYVFIFWSFSIFVCDLGSPPKSTCWERIRTAVFSHISHMSVWCKGRECAFWCKIIWLQVMCICLQIKNMWGLYVLKSLDHQWVTFLFRWIWQTTVLKSWTEREIVYCG